MKSLVLFSYKQPVEGSKFRWGVLKERRNTDKQPLSAGTINGGYRRYDPEFKSCLLYTSPSPRDAHESRMPSSA